MDYKALLKLAVKAAIEGGEQILNIYNTDFLVETKSDDTPVTLADKTSGHSISQILNSSGIPVISEEEEVMDYDVRKNWKYAWIVDPLDGTKEYVKRNGEFAVNIALVKDNKPVIGVIYAPVLKVIYFAVINGGSYRIQQNDMIFELSKEALPDNLFEFGIPLPISEPPKTYTVVVSRSHLSREVQQHIDQLKNVYGEVDCISVGSSIKQCWVAEGKAHEYPRFGRTMEWDTAAGQCILEQSGGSLVNFETRKPMKYNKKDMSNSFFIAKFH
jgi:3'(2'), 5'-bisphosphate nucleotidase